MSSIFSFKTNNISEFKSKKKDKECQVSANGWSQQDRVSRNLKLFQLLNWNRLKLHKMLTMTEGEKSSKKSSWLTTKKNNNMILTLPNTVQTGAPSLTREEIESSI